MRGVVALVLTVTTLAGLLGVWSTHMTVQGLMFGTGEASLAILALVISVVMWHKVTKKMCPCNKGGCAAGSCGKGAECKCAPEHGVKEEKHHAHHHA